MNRTEFWGNADVQGFVEFFGRCLTRLRVSYITDYGRIRREDRAFDVTGIAEAIDKYAWPATDTTRTPHTPLYDWASTLKFLTAARHNLQEAIAAADEPSTWLAVNNILDWGLRPGAADDVRSQLRQATAESSVSSYLTQIRTKLCLATVNTNDINNTLIPYASSGLSKVHSLASSDGLIIYDSRVAATIGECINEYLRRSSQTSISAELQIYVERHHPGQIPLQRRPAPLQNGANHPAFVRDFRWIECQVRVSWLFDAVLRANPSVFSDAPSLSDRMHRLEAACFMTGAYLLWRPSGQQQLRRSFDFRDC